MTRRAVIAAYLAAGRIWAADPAREVWEVITGMAAGLGRADPGEFLAPCDKALPGYSGLSANVSGLVAQVEVESGVDPVRNEGDGRTREVEVDWLMHLADRAGLLRVTEREQAVKFRFERRGRAWKVISLEPIAFFAPPSA